MSNRTDFDALAAELVEMYRLDLDSENCVGDKLLWRLQAELHNAYAAGQESVGRESRAAVLRNAADQLERLASRMLDGGELARCAVPCCALMRDAARALDANATVSP